jgi:cytosine/adenosine deaminase-related metal-dependent hydrolase
VREGVRLSRAGGVAMVGDIAGVRSTVPTIALRETSLAGVSFFEIFGIGRTQAVAIEAMQASAQSIAGTRNGVRLGIQPHAPYSCGPDVYHAAAALGLPLATHLAETRDELEFVARGKGPLADMLKRIGVWDDSVAGNGLHAVDHVVNLLRGMPFIAAHLNYIDDRHIDALTCSQVSVAYCPRASAYFGHCDHRYRDMLAAGVNVALGTDSMLCLDTPDRISTLDEMRLLHRRDGTDAIDLLRMATINGARALDVRESLVTLAPGESAGLLALNVDSQMANARSALANAFGRDDAPRWVLGPIAGEDSWFK